MKLLIAVKFRQTPQRFSAKRLKKSSPNALKKCVKACKCEK